MGNTKNKMTRRLGVFVILLSLLIIPNTLFGGEANRKLKEESVSKADFVLTIKENLVFLSAKDASLKEIIEEIGRGMKVDVVTYITEKEKITIEFDTLALEDAIKRLMINNALVYDTKKMGGKITKIIILPKAHGKVLSIPTTQDSKVEEQKSLANPESREGKEVAREWSPQLEPEKSIKVKSPRPEPFKFEFDPSAIAKKAK